MPPPNLSAASDQDLVAWARQGHERAYYELVRRCRPRVYTLVYRTVRDHHVAEELVQDAFYTAFRKLKGQDAAPAGSRRGSSRSPTTAHWIT